MRRLALLLPLLLGLAGPALGFEPPGLSGDSAGYEATLSRRFPAGATPAQRAASEARARAAEARGDWAAAAAAWEERLGAGETTGDLWLALARAQLRRTPPDAARALQAGWLAFMQVPAGPAEIPSLLVMAEAMDRLGQPAWRIEALQAVVERAPADAVHRAALAEARREAGLLVRRITTEPEAEPARACLTFTSPPARRTDWQPADWIAADPPLPGMAVTREGDALCAAGLPWGRTTRLTLRAGLPGEDGLRVMRDMPVAVAMPNRAPRIVFDSRAFLLPRGQAPRLGVAVVNVSALNLRLVRVTERNLVPLTRHWRLGTRMDEWLAEDLPESRGRVVWEGRAELPAAEVNRLARLALPLPAEVRDAGPGLYVLLAQPGDGVARGERLSAAVAILATDLGVTTWRGPEGVAAQIRGFSDARPRAGVRVALMARNNDVLAEAETDALGLVRFGAGLMRGQGPLAPVSLHAFAGEDFAALDLEAASFDLSDRGAAGRPHPGRLDAFLWLDRGIYRPGETVQAMALLRDGGGAPADIPARLRIRRPNGQVFLEQVPPRGEGAAIHLPITLSASAPVGLWTMQLLADPDAPPIGSTSFRVEAFVPERLEVTAGPAPGPLVPGAPVEIPVTARFLYGAPAAGLEGHAELRLAPDPEPFEAWRGWRFGLQEEPFVPDLLTFDIPGTDADGRTTLSVGLPRAPDSTRPLRAEVAISVAEPGGRENRARLTLPVRGTEKLIALRPAFEGEAVDANTEAAFDIAALSPAGNAIPARLRLRLVRERPDWRIVFRGRLAGYETVWRDEPVDSAEIEVAPGRPARFARTLPFGRYRIEVSEPGGLAVTSMRFRSGWAGGETAEVPDRVDIAADRRAYAPGEVARIRVTPPFAGRASVAVLTSTLVSLREVEIPEGGAELEVPVDPTWGPGAHLAVTVFRPGEAAAGRPARALGLAWLGLDLTARRLEVAIETPDLVRPRRRVEVPVRVTGGPGGTAMLTLAAVDEGVLRLTAFASPDPVAHFLGRRRLGTDIRDDYGRLIVPPDGESAVLRQGGDGGGEALPEIPQRIVALFSGPVAVGADGRATIPLDLPDFAGELRLMAVAWQGARIGAAARPLTVREEVVAEALLPRFLAPGDEAALPVLLHNIELPEGELVAELTAGGAMELTGPTRLAARLAPGARAVPVSGLRAVMAGEGTLRLAVAGPNGFRTERSATLAIRSSRPPVTEIAVATVPPGAQAAVPLPAGRFIPGTWQATASWGMPVRYDAAALLRALRAFPLDCLEQASSRLLALAHTPPNPDTAAEDAAAMGVALRSVLDRQRYDGEFGFWTAEGASQPWASLYAVEALLRARAAGATLPEAPLAEALSAIEADLEGASPDDPQGYALQAYRVHVLALAGRNRMGAARRLMERLEDLPTPLARAQLGAALARAGDRPRAEAAFAAAFSAPARQGWGFDFGSPARDALATALLLRESGVAQDRLPALLARLPAADLTPAATSTQEQAWAVAAAAVLGRDGRPLRLSLDGRDLPVAPVLTVPLTTPGMLRNRGEAPVAQAVSVTGIPTSPLPAASQGMRVARRFLDSAGQPLNLDALRQGTVFTLLVEARATTGDRHQAMVSQGLPAGWEIVGRLGPGEVAGMPWLGTLTEPDFQPARDDRFMAAVELTPEQPLARFAVRLRATTAGRFELPGAEAQDMYRPGTFARQNSGRVSVLP